MVQIFMFLNIIPGFMMLIICAVGFYTLRERSVDMNCLMTWGMICLVNGVFDTVFLIDRAVKMERPLFSLQVEKASLYNFIHFLILAGPCAELCTAYLVYKVYKDATDGDGFAVDTSFNRAASNSRPQGVSGASGGGYGSQDLQSGSTFTPFGGKGNTLGAQSQNESD
eukprot:CAMPEP_0178985554 /NCGR_PEP_ID=MMETSP0795-20121207/2216_1 /TAXON_ID=88552 /ORGANISM="Amoebophrya sp., Strain Ameob2" /LENGTH=167 /DNA_ID=CAMNT_0020676523 /DNA_START=214 /DNA_END=717 /DNA_ORIENTATION=-